MMMIMSQTKYRLNWHLVHWYFVHWYFVRETPFQIGWRKETIATDVSQKVQIITNTDTGTENTKWSKSKICSTCSDHANHI